MRDIFIPGRVATLQGEDPEEENIGGTCRMYMYMCMYMRHGVRARFRLLYVACWVRLC